MKISPAFGFTGNFLDYTVKQSLLCDDLEGFFLMV